MEAVILYFLLHTRKTILKEKRKNSLKIIWKNSWQISNVWYNTKVADAKFCGFDWKKEVYCLKVLIEKKKKVLDKQKRPW